jgi:hypothetical protein
MLFSGLLMTAIVLLPVYLIACAGRIGMACASLLAGVVGLYIGIRLINPFFPTLGLVFTGCVGVSCLKAGKGVRNFVLGSLASVGFSLVLVCALGGIYVYRCLDLRDRYPYASLAPRLAYEARPRSVPTRTEADTGRLEGLERLLEGWGNGNRPASLAMIHGSAVQLFIDSPGFGPGRRLGPTPGRAAEKEYPPIPFDQEERASDPTDNPAESSPPLTPPQYALDSHSNGLVDFVNVPGFGHVLDRDHVAGFQPHQFRKRAYFWSDKGHWLVRRLELVSLLKFEEPAVYVSDHLPRMDSLGDGTTTRPLDAFERNALESLRRGEDLIAVPGTRDVRLLGSIRAAKQCLACHTAERGELLGAFSYVLRLEPKSP